MRTTARARTRAAGWFDAGASEGQLGARDDVIAAFAAFAAFAGADDD